MRTKVLVIGLAAVGVFAAVGTGIAVASGSSDPTPQASSPSAPGLPHADADGVTNYGGSNEAGHTVASPAPDGSTPVFGQADIDAIVSKRAALDPTDFGSSPDIVLSEVVGGTIVGDNPTPTLAWVVTWHHTPPPMGGALTRHGAPKTVDPASIDCDTILIINATSGVQILDSVKCARWAK